MIEHLKHINFIPEPEDDRTFPAATFRYLWETGLLNPIEEEWTDSKTRLKISNATILPYLIKVGSLDLSVGRLLEGHYNALLLILTYGTAEQISKVRSDLKNETVYGVWNTEREFEGVRASKNTDGTFTLKGAKIFCSGSICIEPLITARIDDQVFLVLIPSDIMKTLEPDWSLWNPMGMNASTSSRIDFTGITITQDQIIGDSNQYFEEPYFHGGSIRFAAVQYGGALHASELAMEFLINSHRTEDIFQMSRMAETKMLLETCKLWLQKAIEYSTYDLVTDASFVNYADMLRTTISNCCNQILALAEKSIGLQSFMKTNKLEKVHRDLSTYLKQPGPDAAILRIGKDYFQNG